jgi:hypothetical protein
MTAHNDGSTEAAESPALPQKVEGGWKAFIFNAFLLSFILGAGLTLLGNVASGLAKTLLAFPQGVAGFCTGTFALLAILLIGSYKKLPWRPFAPALCIFIWQGCMYLPLPAYMEWKTVETFGAVAELAAGVWALLRLQRMIGNRRPWLTPEAVADCPFSFFRTIVATSIQLFALTPLFLVYLFTSLQLVVSRTSNGFLMFNLTGVFTESRTYEKEGHEVLLLPTMHIGASSFYDELLQTLPAENSAILTEGVTDRKKLMKAKLDYSGVAGAVGLTAQPSLAEKRKQAAVKFYDADISDFSPDTISVLNGIGRAIEAASNSDSAGAIEALSELKEPDTATLLRDILDTRNSRVLAGIEAEMPLFRTIAVPWGAAHMPGIEMGLLKMKMHLTNQRRVKVFGWNELSFFPQQ